MLAVFLAWRLTRIGTYLEHGAIGCMSFYASLVVLLVMFSSCEVFPRMYDFNWIMVGLSYSTFAFYFFVVDLPFWVDRAMDRNDNVYNIDWSTMQSSQSITHVKVLIELLNFQIMSYTLFGLLFVAAWWLSVLPMGFIKRLSVCCFSCLSFIMFSEVCDPLVYI